MDKFRNQPSYGNPSSELLEDSNFELWKSKIKNLLDDQNEEQYATTAQHNSSSRKKMQASIPHFNKQNNNLYPEIVAPSAIYFPNPCCIGCRAFANLTVHNVNKLWVQCILTSTYQTFNGQDCSQSAFEVKDRIILRPNGDEEIEVGRFLNC